MARSWAGSRQQGPRGRPLVSAALNTCECEGGGAAGAGTATGIAGAASAGMPMGADEVGVVGASAANRVAGTAAAADVAVKAVESVAGAAAGAGTATMGGGGRLPALGKLPMKSAFHGKVYSLDFVQVSGAG